MKKKIIALILSAITAFACFSLTACGEDKPYGDQYDFTNIRVNHNIDEGVVIDGKADEEFWQGKSYYTDESSDGSKSTEESYRATKPFVPAEVSVATHFTDKGVYYYAAVDDKFIASFDEKNNRAFGTYYKTGFSFYICRSGVTSLNDNGLEIAVATDNRIAIKRYKNGYQYVALKGIEAKAFVKSPVLNERGNGTCDGYSVELFVPWSCLGLEEKPSYVRTMFATVRHKDGTGNTTRSFEWLSENISTTNPTTWDIFREDGFFVVPKPVDYAIDGDLTDWASYTANGGVERRVDLYSIDGNGAATDPDTDPRFVRYGMIKGSNGIYLYTEALMRLCLTGEDTWWKNTNIELKFEDKYGTTLAVYATANGAIPNTFSCFKAADSGVTLGSEQLKLITAEFFIPYETLRIMDIEVEVDVFKVGYAFRNGQRQNATDPFELDKNEVIKVQTPGGGASQPFIFYEQGKTLSFRHNVTDKGIVD